MVPRFSVLRRTREIKSLTWAVFFSFLLPQLCEYLLLFKEIGDAMALGCARGSESEEEPSQPSFPDAEIEAYLKALKRKWGIPEEKSIEVVCTCKCCGDRCPMGAACCCPSEKIPLVTGKGPSLRGIGCFGEAGKRPDCPASLFWVYLLFENLVDPVCVAKKGPVFIGSFELLNGHLNIDPPPPKTS